MYLCLSRLLRRPRESGIVRLVSKDCNPLVKAGPHKDLWFAAKRDISLYLQTVQKTCPRSRFFNTNELRCLFTGASCNGYSARRDSRPCKVLSTPPSLDLVLELELVLVSPRTWEPSLAVPPAKSGLLKGVPILVMWCNSWQIMGYMIIARYGKT